jgi:hypothetical protein
MHILFFPSESTFGVANGINKSSAKLRPAFAFFEDFLRKTDAPRQFK